MKSFSAEIPDRNHLEGVNDVLLANNCNQLAVVTVISGFEIETRVVGRSPLPRLCSKLNKRIFDRKLNGNNSY